MVSELPILQEMVKRYPYSSTLRMLYVSGLNQTEDIRTDDELMQTAIHAPSRKHLHTLMQISREVHSEQPEDLTTEKFKNKDQKQPSVEQKESNESLGSEISQNEESLVNNLRVSEQNHEESIKEVKTPKSAEEILLEKQYVTKAIESSIKLDVAGGHALPSREDLADLKKAKPRIKSSAPSTFSDFLCGPQGPEITMVAQEISGLSKQKKNFYSSEKMAQDSLIDRVDFMTETLADIYLRQGYYAKAIRAFEHLRLKYPEKSTYFGDRIAKIKKAIA